MDERLFDDLVRMLALGSRRRFLLALGGGAIGALIDRGGGAAASCRAPGRICREHANCCSGICGPKDTFGRHRCVCAPGLTACDDACVDLQSDPTSCGACGVGCGDLAQVASAECTAGQCAILACEPGFDDCDQHVATGCETALGTDGDCASCGDSCDTAGGEACVGGVCELVCVPSGGACKQHGSCCSSWCEGTCAAATCAPVGDSCDFNEDCCSRVCLNNQECIDCIPAGEPCVVVDHCCSKTCSGGFCGSAACIGLGGSCITYNDDCCPGGSCEGTCL